MSGNHTPTPWRIDEYHSVIGPDGKEIHANGFSSIMSYGPAMLDARANAELIVTAVNSYAFSQAEIEKLRAALEYAAKGLDMIHNGLMDPTRPRQAVGEVCAHFLDATNNAALSGSKE